MKESNKKENEYLKRIADLEIELCTAWDLIHALRKEIETLREINDAQWKNIEGRRKHA